MLCFHDLMKAHDECDLFCVLTWDSCMMTMGSELRLVGAEEIRLCLQQNSVAVVCVAEFIRRM
jgi:hypothetical protein